MGRTFQAQELADCGFISGTLPAENFREQVLAIAEETAKFSTEALAVTKNLIRGFEREQLIKANESEIHNLKGRLLSKDSIDAIKAFAEAAKRKKAAKKQTSSL
jgi:peroxisomal 3,2-trans-enoyl-CoA isomerase